MKRRRKGKKKSYKNQAMILLLVLVGYRFGSPFLVETKKVETKVAEKEAEIAEIEKAEATFSSNWVEKMNKQEREIKKGFPDNVYSHTLYKYFVTDFKAKNSEIEYGKMSPSLPYVSNQKADPQNPGIRLRAVRYPLQLKMKQQTLIPFIKHVERYPGLFSVQTFKLELDSHPKWKTALLVNMNLEFYLTPQQWLGENQKRKIAMNSSKAIASSKSKKPATTSQPKEEGTNWFGFGSGEDEKVQTLETLREKLTPKGSEVKREGRAARKVVRKPTQFKPPKIRFKVAQIVGEAIIVEGDIYEEGEVVKGWKFVGVDKSQGKVTFKRGKYTKTVGIK